jgi:hypothetical protein
MANLIKYIPSQRSELSLQWVADEFTRISSVLNEGLTIEDEGVALETSADTLNFVGSGVVASGTGSEKTITITGGGGGSDLTIKDEGSTLPTAATTLYFVGDSVTASGTGAEKTITISGGGVTDHGALTGLTDDDHSQYVHTDITRNCTVGYTSDVEAVSISSGTLTPSLTLEHLKTLTVSGDFTLGVPGPAGKNGFCEYRVTVSGVGPWTMTKGTNVELVGTDVTFTSGTKYVLNIRKYSDTDCVAQLSETG